MNTLHRKSLIFIVSTLFLSTILITQAGYSQEKDSAKKIRIKVITVKDGEETKFDTTFNAEDFDKEAFQAEMKEKYGIEMEELIGEEGVKVRADSEKADAVGVETKTETEKVVVIKEISAGSDEDLIWEEIGEKPEGSVKTKKVYVVTDDGEKFTIMESGDQEKVIHIVTEDGEQEIIKEGDDKKVIHITKEGETKVLKGEEGEKIIIMKSGDDKCDRSKKDKKVVEETIKVIVIKEKE